MREKEKMNEYYKLQKELGEYDQRSFDLSSMGKISEKEYSQRMRIFHNKRRKLLRLAKELNIKESEI